MGLRSTIGDWVLGPVLERPIRDQVDAQMASRDSEIAALKDEVVRLEGGGGGDADLAAEVARLKKKLNMAMGAIQAATADLMSLRTAAEEATAAAGQAKQQATSALSTAESAADGISGLEEEIAALKDAIAKLASAGGATKKKK